MTASNADDKVMQVVDTSSEAFGRRLVTDDACQTRIFKALESWLSQFGEVIEVTDEDWSHGAQHATAAIEVGGTARTLLIADVAVTFEQYGVDRLRMVPKITDRDYIIQGPEE